MTALLATQPTPIDDSLFDKLPDLMTPKMIQLNFHYEVSTVYDWKYRPASHGVPDDLFEPSFGRKVLIRKDVFKRWMRSRG